MASLLHLQTCMAVNWRLGLPIFIGMGFWYQHKHSVQMRQVAIMYANFSVVGGGFDRIVLKRQIMVIARQMVGVSMTTAISLSLLLPLSVHQIKRL